MPIYLDYLKYQKDFEKKYGPKTIVLIQVGGFFEFYGIENDGHLQKVYEVSEVLNMCVATTSKFSAEAQSNILMAGFPLLALDKQLMVLIKNNYTVVIIEQYENPLGSKVYERRVSNIYSPGTYIQNNNNYDSNNVLSIYISQEKDYKTRKVNYIIGISVIDLSTAKCYVHEIYGKPNDKDYIYEEAIRFVQTFNPREIILTYDEKSYIHNSLDLYLKNNDLPLNTQYSLLNKEQKKEFKQLIKTIILSELATKLEIGENKIYIRQDLNTKEHRKMDYINTYLKKIYTDTNMLTPIQYISLESNQNTLFSYMALLEFSYEHNENIIKNINKPVIYEDSNHLILENNTIQQLNIISFNRKEKSLFDVIDYTSTSIGRRILKENLLMPLIDIDKINNRYDNIDKLLVKKNTIFHYELIEDKLNGIIDLERYHRKMPLNMITPGGFYNLNTSYKKIVNLIESMQKKNIDLLPNEDVINEFKDYMEYYNSQIIIDICNRYNNLSEIDSNIFKPGVNTYIEELQGNINNYKNYLNVLCNIFDNILREKLCKTAKHYGRDISINKPNKKKSDEDKLKEKIENENEDDIVLGSGNIFEYCRIDSNDRSGYYISMTKKRYDVIVEYAKEHFNKHKKHIRINKDHNLNVDNLVVDKTSGGVKISNSVMKNLSINILSDHTKLKAEIKEQFNKLMTQLYKDYNTPIKEIESFIGNLDFVKSCAKASYNLNYVRPNINSNDESSYVNCEELRHPIIERINNTMYIPNWVRLGVQVESDKLYDSNNRKYISDDPQMDGMLLFSCNSLGKSSYMKSVGLSVILAQMGMFVPAKEFTYYPFRNLMTRIIGNDNMHKGQSSFAVEMSELRGIINRADKYTLVLGDEVCHGTEQNSGIALVATTLKWLAAKNVKYIFATHLHQLSRMNEIKDINNVKSYHLQVKYDDENDRLIYNRKLCPGSGSSIYGIEVARAMGLDEEFISQANSIRKKYTGLSEKFLNPKQSAYNSKLYVKECEICGEPGVDTHHIIFQSQADENNNVDHRHKNHYSNLVILCKNCHHSVHGENVDKKLIINGYLETSDGIVLDYKFI